MTHHSKPAKIDLDLSEGLPHAADMRRHIAFENATVDGLITLWLA